MSVSTRQELRTARHARIRKRVKGTADCPRLAVYRSLKHIYAQLIDDVAGVTIAAAGTNEKDFGFTGNLEGAKQVGKTLAERAKEKGVTKVVFDRGGNQYHGRVAGLAEGARDGGLIF